MTNKPDSKAHQFGGDWTTQKLHVLAGYLNGYTTALKNTPFSKIYIDAFAGTGYRSRPKDGLSAGPTLFPDLVEPEPQGLLDGSARLALQTSPAFDRYVFVESSQTRCSSLEGLKSEFPDLAKRIEVQNGEANARIQALCKDEKWNSQRAVLFVDPYGMQVEWNTLVTVAETRAIDLWLLFPLGIGVNRLLTKKPEDIPEPWRKRLNLLLGTSSWIDEFYQVKATPSLFGPDQEERVKAKMDTIGRFFNERLREVFAGVAEPGVLRNSVNNPLYLFCFAVGNERGKPIALNIARHLGSNPKIVQKASGTCVQKAKPPLKNHIKCDGGSPCSILSRTSQFLGSGLSGKRYSKGCGVWQVHLRTSSLPSRPGPQNRC